LRFAGVRYFQQVAAFPQMAVIGNSVGEMIELINGSKLGAIGTPDACAAQIERLWQQSNVGFGAYLLLAHNWANPSATLRSYELIAREVMPRCVAKYMGDGVLVYFGYPQAHEDDAERAVRAALELIAAVIALKADASLQTRAGIATGLVVVGDLIGSGSAQEQAIVGETPCSASAGHRRAEHGRRKHAKASRQSLRA
jgi:limonene 1,2-monooxygenase